MNLLQKIAKAQHKPDPIPAGFKDTHGWAKAWGVSRAWAAKHLRDGMRVGVIECIQLKRLHGSIFRSWPYYGPAKKRKA